MDTIGARHLAARLRAGVRVGTTIVLDSDDAQSGLMAGDRGVVDEITPDGVVVSGTGDSGSASTRRRCHCPRSKRRNLVAPEA